MVKAVALSGLLNSGARRPVRSGIVSLVGITRCRAGVAAAEDTTVNTARPPAARTAIRRRPAPSDAWRETICPTETLNRTGQDGIRGVGYPRNSGRQSRTLAHLKPSVARSRGKRNSRRARRIAESLSWARLAGEVG